MFPIPFRIPRLKLLLSACLSLLLCFGFAAPAWAFCGFYVAKADTKLYNQASHLARSQPGKLGYTTCDRARWRSHGPDHGQ